jgi:hypothetical protein
MGSEVAGLRACTLTLNMPGPPGQRPALLDPPGRTHTFGRDSAENRAGTSSTIRPQVSTSKINKVSPRGRLRMRAARFIPRPIVTIKHISRTRRDFPLPPLLLWMRACPDLTAAYPTSAPHTLRTNAFPFAVFDHPSPHAPWPQIVYLVFLS